MTLFTKENCEKCDKIKAAFNLDQMGIKVEKITEDNPDVLAELAWYELLDVVERGALPILVLDDGSHINNYVPIKKYLKDNFTAVLN